MPCVYVTDLSLALPYPYQMRFPVMNLCTLFAWDRRNNLALPVSGMNNSAFAPSPLWGNTDSCSTTVNTSEYGGLRALFKTCLPAFASVQLLCRLPTDCLRFTRRINDSGRLENLGLYYTGTLPVLFVVICELSHTLCPYVVCLNNIYESDGVVLCRV